jgi:hypothetical protein
MSRHKSLSFALAVLTLITLLSISCTCPGTVVIARLFPTPTPTHTATPTSTLIPTSTITPTPTNTPTVTPTVQPDLSQTTLTLDDFPAGFEVVPTKDCGISKETLGIDSIEIKSIFCFLKAKPFEMIYGFTALLPTRLMQAAFDARLRQPELKETFIEGMGKEVKILEKKDLPEQKDIGDASVGFTILADDHGFPTCMDLILFRRKEVAAIVWVVYLNRDAPIVTIDGIARKLDARIIQVFPGQ